MITSMGTLVAPSQAGAFTDERCAEDAIPRPALSGTSEVTCTFELDDLLPGNAIVVAFMFEAGAVADVGVRITDGSEVIFDATCSKLAFRSCSVATGDPADGQACGRGCGPSHLLVVPEGSSATVTIKPVTLGIEGSSLRSGFAEALVMAVPCPIHLCPDLEA